MQNNILERLEKDPHMKELFGLLTEKLSNSDMQSLLIEAFRKRSLNTSPSRVLNEYRDNRFYRPSEFPQALLNLFDVLLILCCRGTGIHLIFLLLHPWGPVPQFPT